MTASKPTLTEGCIVDGRFRIDRHLKSHATKHSYSCVDLHNENNPLILKTIDTPETTSASPFEFSQNLSLLRRLRHKNLAQIVAFGPTSEAPGLYIVEEYLDGRDLFCGTTDTSLTNRISLLWEILLTVRFLHRRGIVHGRLRPSNIFLVSDGNGDPFVKLTDFGLSAIDSSMNLSATGTDEILLYTAPERFLGGYPDIHSDIYALGILAYLVSTRKLPFEDTDPGFLIQKHLHGSIDFKPFERMKGGKNIIPCVKALLEKNPMERPSTLDAPIHLLHSALKPEAIKKAYGKEAENRLSATRIVGRDEELNHLRECAARVRKSSRGWTVFVTGDAGSGKSRCLEEIKYWGRLEGWRVLDGSCNVQEEGSYSPYRRILSLVH
ncbi:MAG: protein kinase, partial [Acidobacteriota bacterium]